MGWHAVLEDYLEDAGRNLKISLDQVQPYLTAKVIYSDMGLLDERVDISFLGSLEFEGLILQKYTRLTRIYGVTNDAFYRHLAQVHNSIENIIRLTERS